MLRRFLMLGSIAVVICAVVMVVLASRSPEGLAGALGVWGFVLSVVGVVLGVVGLQTSNPQSSPGSDVQVITAEQGDAFGVQNGTMNLNGSSRPKAELRDNQ